MIDEKLETSAACKSSDVSMFYVDGGPIHNQSIKLAIQSKYKCTGTCFEEARSTDS